MSHELRTQYKVDEIEIIAIIVDADADFNQRWTDIKQHFLSLEPSITLPTDIDKNGLIHFENDITFGIWIMPNNKSEGMLENFMENLVPKEDQLFIKVKSTITEIEAQQLNRYKPIHKSKATMRTWLALQNPPNGKIELLIEDNLLTTNNETCNTFVAWLNKLFNPIITTT